MKQGKKREKGSKKSNESRNIMNEHVNALIAYSDKFGNSNGKLRKSNRIHSRAKRQYFIFSERDIAGCSDEDCSKGFLWTDSHRIRVSCRVTSLDKCSEFIASRNNMREQMRTHFKFRTFLILSEINEVDSIFGDRFNDRALSNVKIPYYNLLLGK